MRKKAKAAAARAGEPGSTGAPSPTPDDRPEAPDQAADPKDVGRHLRNLRRERGLSRSEVARSAGLTKRELAAYESGRAAVPDHDLVCLAGSCGVEVDDLLPGRDALRVGPNGSSLTIGSEQRAPVGTAPDDVLRTYAEMIKQLRDLPAGAPVPWRAEDMAALAHALGGTPASIEARLVELTGASPVDAARMRAVLVPDAAPAGAFTIGTSESIETHDFFSAPRAADPFAPPPPLEASPAPELVHAMAGAPLVADAVTAPPLSTPITAPGPAEPFGFAPAAPTASPVVTGHLDPIAPPSASIGSMVESDVPAYWGIGGEEIFLWGDSTASAAQATSVPVAPPVDLVVAPAPAWVPDPEPTSAPAGADAPAPAPVPVPSSAAPAPAPAPAASAPAPAPAPEPAPSASDEIAWQVGGTIEGPAGDPSAATRWALSDLRVPGDTVVEAVLDFASGTGFGVLFRATADDHGRMSGYSFDVDPLGGAYVVRQWVANIPHWQTLAQTPSSPTRQYGRHTMTIRLVGDALSASVDGVSVMTIPSLSEASIVTGCEPARGHRVGLQATPTADVTVESFRATSV